MAKVGLQSELDVNESPTVGISGGMAPSTWTFIWFGLAVLVVIGFHIRMFGHPVPPTANFP